MLGGKAATVSYGAWFRQWQAEHSVDLEPPSPDVKLGISREAMRGDLPVHGLRHPAERGTCGWYIWSGEYSSEPDFFVPLHVSHLGEYRTDVLPFLDLPPGWRFYISPELRDVWHDPSLLNV